MTYGLASKSLSFFLILVVIANSLLFAALFQPKPAQAILGAGDVVFDPITYISDIFHFLAQVGTWVYDKAIDVRDSLHQIYQDYMSSGEGIIPEMVKNLFLVVVNQMASKLTNDIIAWINGGGKGEIRLIQDPDKFIRDAADEAGGVLAGAILGVDPAKLCNADFLKYTLKVGLTGPYAVPTFNEKVQCTFSGMANGLRAFQEDFSNGGWAAFVQLLDKPNNQAGMTLEALDKLKEVEAERTASAQQKIALGDGYKPVEKCTVTENPTMNADAYSTDPIYMLLVSKGDIKGQTLAQVAGDSGIEIPVLKDTIISSGGAVDCKITTPGNIIQDLANKAFTKPFDDLNHTVDNLMKDLGANGGSFFAPYLSAIMKAGVNLLLTKEKGLISDALTSATRRKNERRQGTQTLQQNVMLTQATGALSGSMHDFHSFAVNTLVDINLFIGALGKEFSKSDVLGTVAIDVNNVPATKWPTGVGTSLYGLGDPHYPLSADPASNPDPSLACTSGALNACRNPKDGNLTVTCPLSGICPFNTWYRNYYTPSAGQAFAEEAQWCGAYSQVTEMSKGPNPEIPPVSTPVAPLYLATLNANNTPLTQLGTSGCPSMTYYGAVTPTAGNCSNANWVTYDFNGDGSPDMATRIVSFNDKDPNSTNTLIPPTRFLRQNIIAPLNASGVPQGTITLPTGNDLYPASGNGTPINYIETIVNTGTDTNGNGVTDPGPGSAYLLTALNPLSGTPTIAGPALKALFEMQPNYVQSITSAPNTPTAGNLPQGLSQAAVASTPTATYVFGGYNQFGFSPAVYNGTGGFVTSLPGTLAGLAGAEAVYYPPNNRIYLFGGMNGKGFSDEIWEFNPVNSQFKKMAAHMPSPVYGTSGVYYSQNKKIYLFGGSNDGALSRQILEFNQTTDTIIAKTAQLPLPTAFAATAAVNGKIYIIGGMNPADTTTNDPLLQGSIIAGAIYEYDPAVLDDNASGAISAKGSLNTPREFAAAFATAQGKIDIYGGQTMAGLLADAETFDPQTGGELGLTGLASSLTKAGKTASNKLLVGGITDTAPGNPGALIYPQGDIYLIPGEIPGMQTTEVFKQKYSSPKFDTASAYILNYRQSTVYSDFTKTIANMSVKKKTNQDPTQMFLARPFYPELYEKAQELLEKMRIVNGYNYNGNNTCSSAGIKYEDNYQAGLAVQLGSVPDDNPLDNNPTREIYKHDVVDSNNPSRICEQYKGSVNDVLTKYNDLSKTYQMLFAGLTDENTLESLDRSLGILSPEETNIRLSLIGKRCPTLPPSATSSPDLFTQCPVLSTGEYNMARRFVFEPDDSGINSTGLTTGFTTNPFDNVKSSALGGILNLEEMATQLASLPPNKNIVKLIRLRQILEGLQVWRSTDPANPGYGKALRKIPVPGKVNAFVDPNALSGVDTIQISIPGYEKIETWLNATSTTDALGTVVPLKNEDIQDLITAYGYATAKEAYPEISKQLDDIFDNITGQVVDKLKEVFLKRVEEQLEGSRGDAQQRLAKFITYVRDLNSTVKLEAKGDEGALLQLGFRNNSVSMIGDNDYLLKVEARDAFADGGKKINAMLADLAKSSVKTSLKKSWREALIGSAMYKIKTLARFIGIDTSSTAFTDQMSKYSQESGDTAAAISANLDERVKNVLRDVYMYYTGISNQTDPALSSKDRNVVPPPPDIASPFGCSISTQTGEGYYCNLTVKTSSGQAVKIHTDARAKIDELNNDFNLMLAEADKIKGEFQNTISSVKQSKQELDDFVKLLTGTTDDYERANGCFSLSTNAPDLWQLSKAPTQGNTALPGDQQVIFDMLHPTGKTITLAPQGGLSTQVVSSFFDTNTANVSPGLLDDTVSCQAGIADFYKHIHQLADEFLCGSVQQKYQN